MSTRNQIIVAITTAVIATIAITYPLWSPFFFDDVVDESFPTLGASQRNAIRDMPPDQRNLLIEIADDDPDRAAETALAMIQDDTLIDEAMPAQETVTLASGSFNTFDPVHQGEGTATVYQLPDGNRFLRLEDFSVTNGPQLHVVLVSDTPSGILDDTAYLDLGPLKGNIGSHNYDIPAEADLVTVSIYSVPFEVHFSVAELASG